MKGTARARLVGVGRERPDYVDKDKNWGATYADEDKVARELRGEVEWLTCHECGDRLMVVDGKTTSVVRQHERTRRHRRLSEGPA